MQLRCICVLYKAQFCGDSLRLNHYPIPPSNTPGEGRDGSATNPGVSSVKDTTLTSIKET